MRKFVLIIAWLCVAPLIIAAQEQELKVPAEVAPLVEKGTKTRALEKGDLNGDGREDFILVLEKENPANGENDSSDNQRTLLILVRGADGKLSVAKRNERIIMSADSTGDSFMGVVVGRNTFSVKHMGGGVDRWETTYKFNYSQIDQTWQLVRVEETNYNSLDPKSVKTKIRVPGKDFGKIDIADFDPDNYLKKGAK